MARFLLEKLIPKTSFNYPKILGIKEATKSDLAGWNNKMEKLLDKDEEQSDIEIKRPIKLNETGNVFLSKPESSIKFPYITPKGFHAFFYKTDKIICFYNDTPKEDEGEASPSDDEGGGGASPGTKEVGSSDDEDESYAGGYEKFIKAILKQGTEEGSTSSKAEGTEITTISDDIINNILGLNQNITEEDSEVYYEKLEKALLKIIESVDDINLVITIMPKESIITKGSILVGNTFNVERNTVGLNIYSTRYYERADLEEIEISLLTLLEQSENTPPLTLDFNLKNFNTYFDEKKKSVNVEVIDGKIGDDSKKVSGTNTEKSNTTSKLKELLEGESIVDNYFSDWVKIEINQIKNKNFDTFLVEPENPGKNNRKLLKIY